MDIAGARKDDVATTAATLTKATPEQFVQLVYMPGAAHPAPVRVPGDHPSAGVPSECLRDPRRSAVTRMGRCHSGGPLSLGWAAVTRMGCTSTPWSQSSRGWVGSVDEASGGATALTDQTAALPLGGSTPYSRLLAYRQGVLEAGDSHAALGADRLCLQPLIFVIRVEDRGFQPTTLPELPPLDLFGRHDWIPPLLVSARLAEQRRESRFAGSASARPSL